MKEIRKGFENASIDDAFMVHVCVCVCMFNIEPRAMVIWRPDHSFVINRQEKPGIELGHWFTQQVVYPKHHSGSFYGSCKGIARLLKFVSTSKGRY